MALAEGPASPSAKATIEPTKKVSSGGSTKPAALAIIEEVTKEIMARTGLSEAAARDQALTERPSLYRQYIEEFRRRATGGIVSQEDDTA